ncbi:capsular polysaccharide biosynthesis protein [Halomonas sabkhae]|uniref:capsular polysaccharide biosynthesis protein n=1 Tax=Halomonas sabkhae TaxID=626223 RepID=UPI0025B3C83B|nr:capsular polysaccharide biosynthesis protein [Halomonas sabkhae]MDN3526586.1 capsular polysaccharide biosynthesis protein [Halomonas sabkhae]
MRALPILRACLPEFEHFPVFGSWAARRAGVIAGWGLKPSSRKARDHAEAQGLPYLAVEDGFLRSWGLGVEGHPPHSLIVDSVGIYYDASRPSELEQLIQAADNFPANELERARRGMQRLRELRLSKYNHAPDRQLFNDRRPRVLIVDQTAGDASIEGALAAAEDFQCMLDHARSEHPDAEILVKVHPDVIAGKKAGHLLHAGEIPGCRLIGEVLNPWSLLDAVECVHVVSSQLGFEALMAGKRVVCHGVPFYAGWGLTDDRKPCARRNLPRSLEQVFAAAYLRYARYANPYTGLATDFEEALELIGDQTRQQQRLAGDWAVYGLSSWKRGFVGDFLGALSRVRHIAHDQPPQDAEDHERILCWASRLDADAEQRCQHAGHTLWRMEDGFLRSIGLGVDLARPLSLVVDALGIHYDAHRESELERLLNEAEFSPALLERAAGLRQRLVALRLSKYNLPGRRPCQRPQGDRVLLVTGQVETDASIANGTFDIRTNGDLLAAVREANPDARILYKPHPDVLTGARIGALDPEHERLHDEQVSDVDIVDLLDMVDEVHTMGSLAGFEGLLRGKHVVTYGMPFYAGWGLTEDRHHCPRRRRTLELDALVAATLILYPLYVDPGSRRLCNAETVVTLLEQQRAQHHRPAWWTHLYRWYRNTFIGKH